MADYYVSPSGNDGNAGTIGSPFRNWQKLKDVLTPGDTGWIRGGTYTPTTATTLFKHCDWDGIVGTATSPIIIQNYPGEVPIYDFTGFVLTVSDSFCVFMTNCQYLKVKGLRATNFAQISDGSGISRGWGIDESPNCTIENCEVDNMGGSGFAVGNNCAQLQFINCDSHHNADPNSPGAEYGGSDGWQIAGGITGTDVTLVNCRAWWNSDDGFDNFGVDTVVTYKGCWAFWNGYVPGTFTSTAPHGNGEGYKLGPTNTVPLARTTKILTNCLAFENRTHGFGMNTAETRMSIINCTAYNNVGWGFNFGWYPSYAQPFYNNVAWDNTAGEMDETGGNVAGSNNTWDGGVTVSDADFVSVSSTGVDGARGSDGSLPTLTFLHLVETSDLVNAGTNRGLPFKGSAPDMGAYEFEYPTWKNTKRKMQII